MGGRVRSGTSFVEGQGKKAHLSHLGVIDADDLVLFRASEAEPRDEMHRPADGGCHDERVGHAGDRVRDLVAELDPVVIEPAVRGPFRAVERGDGALSKEAGKDVADDTTDGVGGEDIESLVDAEEELKEMGRGSQL
jgi:hypothetical protein